MPLKVAKSPVEDLKLKAFLNLEAFRANTPPVKPTETHLGFDEEEQAILDYLGTIYPGWVNIWTMLNALSRRDSSYWMIARPTRQRLLAVLCRLKNEGRIVYTRRDRSCALAPSEGHRHLAVLPRVV